MMLHDIPVGVMRPELVQTVMVGLSRKQKFKQLSSLIKTESKAENPDFRLIENLRIELLKLFPECVSVENIENAEVRTSIICTSMVCTSIAKSTLSWVQRAMRMPECFKLRGGDK